MDPQIPLFLWLDIGGNVGFPISDELFNGFGCAHDEGLLSLFVEEYTGFDPAALLQLHIIA
jgi:hypothetical protein